MTTSIEKGLKHILNAFKVRIAADFQKRKLI